MNLVERVKAILMTPKTEWLVIDHEPGDAAYLFTNYVAILAAIPAVCGFIGLSVIGIAGFHIPILTGLINAIVGYILSFVIVYVVALIIDALAPNFGGQKNFESALKVAVYSYTPGWLVGVFLLIPALGILGILALYGLYLMYLGLPVLMKTPQEKSVVYTLVVVVCTIVIAVVLGAIQSAIFGLHRF
jgi:Yip1 domain